MAARSFPLTAAVAIFACGFVILAWPWLSGAVTIPWDAKSQFYPQQVFLARALAQGQSPSWTPNIFAGWPQIADPQSLIFSPLHFLLAAVAATPSFRQFDAVSFAALFLGCLGMILIFRERGWHVAGALVAALAFAFGGSCAWRLQHIGQIMSVAYLPLALWLLMRALERGSWITGVAAGLVAGIIALGRDQVALLSLYVLAGLVVAHVATAARPHERRRAIWKPLVGGSLAGALVIAIPLLMTALLAADSNRPEIDYVGAGRGSLHPAHLLTFAFADLYAAGDPAIPYWGPSSFPWGFTGLFLAQNMGQLYAGALPLVAIVGVGLARGDLWARDIRYFTIAALLVLFYALGWYTPVFGVFYAVLPGTSLFRRPADATFVLGALAALLAGYCVHRLLSNARIGRSTHWMLAGATAAAVLAAGISVAVWKDKIQVAVSPLLFGVAWLLGAVAVLIVAYQLRHRPVVVALLLSAFMTADLAWNNAPNESTGLPPAHYEALRLGTENETVALLKNRLAATAGSDRRDRVEFSGIGYHWPNLGLVHDLAHVFAQNPLRLKDFARATGIGDTVAIPEQRTFAPLFPSYRSAFADLLGLRFIATGVPIEQIDSSLTPGDLNFVARTADAYVYENPRALPRVTLVTKWQQVDFEALLRSGWPDFDPRRTVLLERPPVQTLRVSPQAGGTARILRYENAEVVIEVDAPGGGLLVLNDVWHPWWFATVDAAPVELLKANVLFRAVTVPPGRHVVKFEFRALTGSFNQLARKLAELINVARR
ncbi:MAG TPA: hypothetical protein VHG27_08065 [Xanthobacteraceae bacterium]|nr:hypothetical protein [Xanthobacteraceae bacterium]